MSKDVRCGTCKYFEGERCLYYKSTPGPAWAEGYVIEMRREGGVGCRVWEPAEPKVAHTCGTCEHWAERGQGQDGYGHGPCNAVFPVWALPPGIRVSREMRAAQGENCTAWKWREYEEDIQDE